MKLRSIEAVRYGGLENACLPDIGEGLTVVLGPNESGKSSLTALARHVLFGFPDRRSKERGYVPLAGGRAGRLVFADGASEWAIERVDGSHRGPVSVVTRSGADRPGLLGEIVGGVSEQTYRVVFGFGLDELSEIEHGDNSDIVARLYAAETGLSVNPIDVRAELEGRANALFAARAQKPVLNTLNSRIRDLKERIRALETRAADFAGDQARLNEMAEQLEPLKERRDELDVKVRSLAADIASAKGAAERVKELGRQSTELAARLTDLERSLALLPAPDPVLDVAPELSAVLEEESGFKTHVAAADKAQADADRIETPPGLPVEASDSPAARRAVDEWSERLSALRNRVETSTQAAERAAARAGQLVLVAGEQQDASASRPAVWPVALLLAGGLLGIVLGIALDQWAAVLVGAAASVAGAWLLFSGRRQPVAAAPLSHEAAAAQVEAGTQAELADNAKRELQAATAEWHRWLADNKLDAHGQDPLVVRRLLDDLAERERRHAERERCLGDARREREAAEDWITRLVDIVRRFDPQGAQVPSLSGAAQYSARARARLAAAISSRDERSALERENDINMAERESLARQLDEVRAVLEQLATRYCVDVDDIVPQLEARAATQEEELSQLRDECDALSESVTELRVQLDAEGRGDEMARARQELEGLQAQAREAADRYVTEMLAVKLLDRARERFERERQPEVVRIAARVFAAMTENRYTDVRAPLDGTEITVRAADGSMRRTTELSRGTAEQLYLALRVGLIGSREEMGRYLPVLMDDVIVNFDEARARGASAAISELASKRQVLFFTCHEDTAQLLADTVPGTVTVKLDRCSL